ncbi:hypothetical protein IE983_05155 [Enterobacter hormaechei]|uniref:Uncharacterized protein n=1 Tax=Enterobacter hormaechei TaxID=158836 RepID=A0A927HKP9_9ENTR|nr:hypothetical protein [Enterobacter hormaechei]
MQFWEAGTATGKAMHDIAQIWAGGEGDLFHWAAPLWVEERGELRA